MQGANAMDNGIYECFPDNAPSAKIKVHILTAGMYLENWPLKKWDYIFPKVEHAKALPSVLCF